MNLPTIQAPSRRLSWLIPLTAVLTVLAVMLPLVCWFGMANPDLFPELSDLSWASPEAMGLAAGIMVVLFFAPLTWMVVSRRGDYVGMWLMQNALLAGGYFFLPDTADRPGMHVLTPAILHAGVLVAAVNAFGFSILLVTLGSAYFFATLASDGVKPLLASPEIYDRRLLISLRFSALFCVGVIVLSMVVTRTIPMLAANPDEARYVFDDNGLTRPLYNASMGILPYVFGGLLVMFLRKPGRFAGLDGGLAGLIFAAQLLSGNRFPLAIAIMVSIVLLSMEKKWLRWQLLMVVTGYFILFIGLSGFTSMWRRNPDKLSTTRDVVADSFRQAYLGNNLIDYGDTAWVFSQWDHQPLMGKTYSAGMLAMIPSAIFPMRKEWHMGLTALRIVGWGDVQHFGLRLSCFGESFLNFGFVGVAGLAIILGILLGTLLRYQRLLSRASPSACLSRNLIIVMMMQMLLIWTNTSDAFMFWALLVWLIVINLAVFYGRRGTLANDRRKA